MICNRKPTHEKMFAEFDRIVGLEHLAAMHLNDSKPRAAPGSIGTSTSGKARSDQTHFASSCAPLAFAKSQRFSKHQKARS